MVVNQAISSDTQHFCSPAGSPYTSRWCLQYFLRGDIQDNTHHISHFMVSEKPRWLPQNRTGLQARITTSLKVKTLAFRTNIFLTISS